MDAKQANIVKQQHEEWIDHPITKLMISVLKKHRDSYVNKAAANASLSAVSDQQIRLDMISVRNTDAITVLLTNFEQFVAALNK